MKRPRSAQAAAAHRSLDRRTFLYRMAWVLYGVAFLLYNVRPLGDAIAFIHQFAEGVSTRRFFGMQLFILSLFSNLIFFATLLIRKAPRLPRGWRTLLLGSVVVNALLPFFLSGYAKTPGYWFWLAAFALMAYTLSALPPVVTAPPEGGLEGAIPSLLWAWLAFTFLWLIVDTIEYTQQGHVQPTTTTVVTRFDSYVTDPSHLLSGYGATAIASELAELEKSTSTQLVVAIYPQAPDADIEGFTVRTAAASQIGAKGRDNGAILFLFMRERVARMEVGYGLESALPDSAVHRILSTQLTAPLAKGDVEGGLHAALGSIEERVRSQYSRQGMPGAFRTTMARLSSVATTFGPRVWPFIRDTTAPQRVGLSFFASLILFGLGSSAIDGARATMNLFRGARNIVRGRPFGEGLAPVEFASIWDTLKFVLLLAIPLSGVIVVIAGGGSFGGAGAAVHW